MHRREFLTLAAGAVAAWRQDRAPAIITRDENRPGMPCGVTTGDVTDGQAIVWSRSDRPARLIVEYSTTASFADTRRVVGPAALEDTDFTARVDLIDLPPGQRISYRARFQDLSDLRRSSEPIAGSFQTPARASAPGRGGAARAGGRDVSFVFSGDCVGQGWGIDPSRGGMRLYEAMRKLQPDVFVHLGDTIYADQPLKPEVVLDDGSIWRNIVTEAKSKPAQTLDDFRGCHRYNFQDEHMRRFNAEVSQIALWDDHEVRDNWWPSQRLDAGAPSGEKSVALLAARAKRAFLEYLPLRINPVESERVYRAWRHGPALEIFALDMRSYRGPNSTNRQTTATEESAILGDAQVAWLQRALAASTATWKLVASDMPLGLVVPDAGGRFDAVANREPGAPLGRELELARLLKFIKAHRIRNVVWIAADVHYCAAYRYAPEGAGFTEFDPFWEFVGGPLHAGAFGPNELDRTFGPEVKFLGIPPGMKPNRPPSEPFQFFGSGRIDARTEALTMKLHNVDRQIFSVELPPAR
jgi:alkaline phosphatase D